MLDGLMYDTDKSRMIYQDRDKRRTYYATKKGRYFIVYATGEFDTISEDRVRDILIEYDYDMYVELFGTPEEA
jgi:hypothetical protein